MKRRAATLVGGFSLLEILVAIAMLAAALAALAQLAAIGRRHLDGSLEKARAARLAANRLELLAAGAEPLEARDAQPLPEDPNWECRVDVVPLAEQGLAEVQVGVRRRTLDAAARQQKEVAWLTFARWLPHDDPSAAAAPRPATGAPATGASPKQRQPAAAPRGLRP